MAGDFRAAKRAGKDFRRRRLQIGAVADAGVQNLGFALEGVEPRLLAAKQQLFQNAQFGRVGGTRSLGRGSVSLGAGAFRRLRRGSHVSAPWRGAEIADGGAEAGYGRADLVDRTQAPAFDVAREVFDMALQFGEFGGGVGAQLVDHLFELGVELRQTLVGLALVGAEQELAHLQDRIARRSGDAVALDGFGLAVIGFHEQPLHSPRAFAQVKAGWPARGKKKRRFCLNH